MTLYRDIGFFEIGLIAVFALLYLLFLWRTFRIFNKMKTSSKSFLFKLVLRTFYFILLLFAFLGPSFGEMKREVKSVGKDIYLLVDLSRSMDAVDISPSRIEKVKFELKNVVNAFSSDRIGLIIFSSDAFIQCPLTYDNNALMMFIETLNTNLVSNTGTDFSPALQMALMKHTEAEEGKSLKKQSKIILLVSDGEDFGEETAAVANEVKEQGIKLFTLGVGTAKGSKIPTGYRFKRDQQGNDVISTLNSNALKKLSEITNGSYFELSSKKNDVARMIESISQIEGEFRDARQVDVAANKYYYFLFLAIVLMFIDVLITVKIVKL